MRNIEGLKQHYVLKHKMKTPSPTTSKSLLHTNHHLSTSGTLKMAFWYVIVTRIAKNPAMGRKDRDGRHSQQMHNDRRFNSTEPITLRMMKLACLNEKLESGVLRVKIAI